MLTLAIAIQRFQHITGRNFKIIQLTCCLELPDFPQGNALEIDKAPHTTPACQLLGFLTLERNYHGSIMTHCVNNVNRYYMARKIRKEA